MSHKVQSSEGSTRNGYHANVLTWMLAAFRPLASSLTECLSPLPVVDRSLPPFLVMRVFSYTAHSEMDPEMP